MRIALLHSRYLSGDLSGENRVVEDEATLLEEAGHEVATFTPSARAGGGSLALARDAIWSSSAVRRVRAIVDEFRPDVVHVHSLYPALSPAVLRVDSPVVMTLHNARLLCLPATLLRSGVECEACVGKVPWRGVAYACYRASRPASAVLATSLTVHRVAKTFATVSLFLAVSEFVRGRHIEAGFDADRIRVKPNFVRPATQRRDGAGSAFMYVGRLTHEKGVDMLLRSWGEEPLVIVGDGEERSKLERMAPPAVRFLGAVPADRVGELLADARALVMPSRSEGQPRVVVEAFAAGVPVVASRVGGLPEQIDDGINGLLVDLDDERGWRAAIEALGADARSTRLGEGAAETWRKRYSPAIALRKLEEAYSEAIGLANRSR